jgi:hypothetical protein
MGDPETSPDEGDSAGTSLSAIIDWLMAGWHERRSRSRQQIVVTTIFDGPVFLVRTNVTALS